MKFFFSLLLLAACSSAEPTGSLSQAVCAPITACGQSTCGTLPDGCGGTFDCGACADPRTSCYIIGVPAFPQCHAGPPFNPVATVAADPAACAMAVRHCQ
jgi:hypothetical protein